MMEKTHELITQNGKLECEICGGEVDCIDMYHKVTEHCKSQFSPSQHIKGIFDKGAREYYKNWKYYKTWYIDYYVRSISCPNISSSGICRITNAKCPLQRECK